MSTGYLEKGPGLLAPLSLLYGVSCFRLFVFRAFRSFRFVGRGASSSAEADKRELQCSPCRLLLASSKLGK